MFREHSSQQLLARSLKKVSAACKQNKQPTLCHVHDLLFGITYLLQLLLLVRHRDWYLVVQPKKTTSFWGQTTTSSVHRPSGISILASGPQGPVVFQVCLLFIAHACIMNLHRHSKGFAPASCWADTRRYDFTTFVTADSHHAAVYNSYDNATYNRITCSLLPACHFQALSSSLSSA